MILFSDNALTKDKSGNNKKTSNFTYKFYEKKGLFPTNLKPVFPKNFSCPGISSPYGSKTRYDGSLRKNPHYGFHNGMDITLKIGASLIAVANGKIIHKGTAGRLVGNYIWLYSAPEDIGLETHAFIRYQHLDKPSHLEIGEKVFVGDEIGKAGKTGTTGGHFGKKGYPHLHIMYTLSENSKFRIKGSQVRSKEYFYFDPMGIYIKNPEKKINNHTLRALSKKDKMVFVPVINKEGNIYPSNSKVIWPVMCTQKK